MGLFVARQLPTDAAPFVWGTAVHIPYLGYPLFVVGTLQSARQNAVAFLAAAAFFLFIPIAYEVISSQGEPPTWYGISALVVAAGWVYVLWHAAHACVQVEPAGGWVRLVVILFFFLLLPWGGVLPLRSAPPSRRTADSPLPNKPLKLTAEQRRPIDARCRSGFPEVGRPW